MSNTNDKSDKSEWKQFIVEYDGSRSTKGIDIHTMECDENDQKRWYVIYHGDGWVSKRLLRDDE